MLVEGRLGDDRAAVAVADQDARARLKVDDPLRRGDVVRKRRFWHLDHGHVVAVPREDLVDRLPTRAVHPGAVDEYDVF